MVDENLKSRIRGAARARDFTKVDELWAELEAQTAWKEDLGLFFDVANDLNERGERERAGTLMLSLLEIVKSDGTPEAAFELARRTSRYQPKSKGLRDQLLEHYKRVYADRAGLDAALTRSGLTADTPCDKAVQVLDDSLRFAAGDYCSHPSGWGIGRVVEAHPETGEYVIDFARRRGQRMEATMAAKSVQKRDPDDLDVLLWTDQPKVKVLAEEDPLSLLKSALKSAPAGKLQARDLREKLEPVLDKNLWTKFWARARKLAKDDPWIEVGAAPKSVITMRAQPLSREAEVTKSVDKAGPFVKKLEAARRELLSVAKDFVAKGQVPGWLKSGVAAMQKDVDTPPKGRPAPNWAHTLRAMRLELAFFKLEAANLMPHTAAELGIKAPDAAAGVGEAVDPETGEPLGPKAKVTTVPDEVKKALEGLTHAELPLLLREMTVVEYRRRVIALMRAAFPEDWTERLRAVVFEPAQGTFETTARELTDGARQVLDDACAKILVNPTKHADAYCALVRARMNGRIEKLLEKRTDVELVAKAIQVLDDVSHRFKAAGERLQKESLKSTVDAFRALFSEKNQRVIVHVTNKERSESEVRRILQLVRQSPALTPTVVRACEQAVAYSYPDLLGTVVAAPTAAKEVEEKLFTTQDGYNKRRIEYDRLVNVELEEVRLEIGRALEFGDISENSELDAAREKQKQLALRIERMRTELEQVTIIDPATVETDQVRVGTRVALRYKQGGKDETFTVLGPWDADEAHHVISFLSPIARALLGKRVGDEVDILLPDGSKVRVEILTIDRANLHVPQHAS